MKLRHLLFATSSLLVSSPILPAATFTWDNGASNMTWDLSSFNWSSPTVPWANTTSDQAIFGAAGVGSVNLATGITANKLTFNIGGYTIAGNTLALGGTTPAILNTAGANTLNSNITLGVASTITNSDSSNPLTLGGTVGKSTFPLTFTGAGATNLTGGLTGTGGFIVDTAGTFTYSATGGTTNDFRVGNGANGNFKITGGDLTVSTGSDILFCQLGTTSTFIQSGGTLNLGSSFFKGANVAGQTCSVDVSAGNWNETGTFMTHQRGAGTLTVSGTANMSVGLLAMGGWAAQGGTAIVNLNGGILSASFVSEQSGSPSVKGSSVTNSTFNFNGGTLKPTASSTIFMVNVDTVNVKNGGAKIDTNTFDITIAKALSHFAGATTDGLTKSGTGTLTLSAASTYSGPTVVNGGTLKLGTGGSIATTPSITLASGSALDAGTAMNLASGQTLAGSGTLLGTITSQAGSTVSPGIGGIGNLAVDGALNLAGNTSIDVSKSGATITSDQLTGLGTVALGGTLTLNTTGDTLAVNDEIHILANTGGVTGDFAGVVVQPALPVGLSLDTSSLTTDGIVRVVNRLSAPLFSLAGGGYVGAQDVTITSDPDTTIYYTTDGSDPTTSLTSGASPVTITVPLNAHLYNVRAVAKKSGQPNSLISSAVYNTVGTPTWIANADGYWSSMPGDEANWQNDVIAGGAGIAADFSTLELAQDTTVILDEPRAIGAMKFGDANAVPQFHWNLVPLNAGSVLTLDGGPNQPVIEVANQNATIGTIMTGTQGFAKTGGGTLKLAAANSYGGTTAVNAGTLEVIQGGSISAASGIAVGAGSLLQFTTTSGSRTIGNAISGQGNVLLSAGAAPTGSNGTNVVASGSWASFTGTLTLDNTRIDSAQNTPGLGAVNLVINDGSQVFANDGGPANFGANSITIAGRGYNAASGTGPLGALRVDNNHHYTGPVILAANAAIGNAAFTGDSYVDGNISGSHELEIIPRYGNFNTKVYLAGNNTYGSTRVTGGSAAPYNGGIGELIANSSTALSPGAVVVDGGRLTLNGYSFTIANLSSTASGGTVRNNHATTAATLTVGTDGSSTSYGGTLADGAAAPLALTKVGAGTLTLGAANTYTGATSVNNGTLTLGTASLADSADVKIATAGTLDLDTAAATDTVGKLFIGGVQQASGIWGSLTSTATHKTERITGTGMLNVTTGPGFGTWADSFPGLTDKTPGGDPDHDGISNLMEYVLGGDPRVSSDEFLPKQSIVGTDLVITYKRSDDSKTDTTLTGQWSTNLAIWDVVVPELVNENGADPDDMRIVIPLSNAAGGKLFGRLQVTQP